MTITEGDGYREKSTGQPYRVKKIKDGTIILEAEGKPDKFWVGDGYLQLFFETMETQKKEVKLETLLLCLPLPGKFSAKDLVGWLSRHLCIFSN
jgi:hypothetical protein